MSRLEVSWGSRAGSRFGHGPLCPLLGFRRETFSVGFRGRTRLLGIEVRDAFLKQSDSTQFPTRPGLRPEPLGLTRQSPVPSPGTRRRTRKREGPRPAACERRKEVQSLFRHRFFNSRARLGDAREKHLPAFKIAPRVPQAGCFFCAREP